METKNGLGCQLSRLPRMYDPIGRIEYLWQFRHKLQRMIKRRIWYVENRIGVILARAPADAGQRLAAKPSRLAAGDRVRVRPRKDIQSTLDSWNEAKGCGFMEEMWKYCGTEQRVYKRVNRFLDENQYRTRKANGIVLLEGLICEGTIDFGACDRSCFFFWREEWLERLGAGEEQAV